MALVCGIEIDGESGNDLTQPDSLPLGKLIEGMSFEDYQRVDAINASGLKTLKRSPAHFWHERYSAQKKDTPAMRLGRLAHLAVLEPERLRACLRVKPDFNMRTTAGKASFDSWLTDQGPDVIVATLAESEMLQGLVGAAFAHSRLKKLLASGKRESSLFWKDKKTGLYAKARYDFVAEGTNIIVDLKTTSDARPQSFVRDSIKYDYGLSAAHYLSGAAHTQAASDRAFAIVAVEKEPPYGIVLYKMSQMELERSQQFYELAMATYAKCRQNDVWPSYEEEWDMITCPPWAPWVIPQQ